MGCLQSMFDELPCLSTSDQRISFCSRTRNDGRQQNPHPDPNLMNNSHRQTCFREALQITPLCIVFLLSKLLSILEAIGYGIGPILPLLTVVVLRHIMSRQHSDRFQPSEHDTRGKIRFICHINCTVKHEWKRDFDRIAFRRQQKGA